MVQLRLKRGVVLHDALYAFREGLGKGTSTLEAKLAQQLAGLAHDTLFQVFLDVCKAYNPLVRGRHLKVLRAYGMVPNLACLIKIYWDRQRIMAKMGKFLGKYFRTGRGVTQGNPAPQMIFNIVVDVVVQSVLDVVCRPRKDQHCLRWEARERNLFFYADDVRIAG